MIINIYNSLLISVIVQVLTGIIEFFSLFIKIPLEYSFLKQMILLELIVQFIEGSFYIYWLFYFKKMMNITPKRYFDWVITTPTMLINLIFYLLFLQSKEYKTSDKLNFLSLFLKEFKTIITVLLLNWVMLLFGYLGEISIIPILFGVLLGFIPFIMYYYIIYKKYAILSKDGLKIYFYFLFFWSLYGIVALLPYKIKNICYNILDLFSKNFFGLFLSYIIYKRGDF
jgi:hypothetical protein